MKNAAVVLVVIVSVVRASAGATVSYETTAPDANGGLLVNVPVNLAYNESRSVRWNSDDNLRLGLAQNFHVNSNIVMDKYAVQLRADPGVSDQVVQLPSGDADIAVSLWELPNLNNSTFAYPAASASGAPIATWTLTVPASIRSSLPTGAHAGDWLVFDTPNIALTAGVQYGIQLGWPTVGPSGQKILIWVSNPPGSAYYPGDYPIGEQAIASSGDPSVNASYDPGLTGGNGNRTYRSENFAIIAVPEPATLGLLSLGSLCCLLSRRRRFQ